MDVSREPYGDDDCPPARRRSWERRRNSNSGFPSLRRSPPINSYVRLEEPAKPDLFEDGANIYDASPREQHEHPAPSDPRDSESDIKGISPIGARTGFKRRREEQDELDCADDESDGAESGDQTESHPSDGEPDLSEHESDPKTSSPTAKRPQDLLTEEDVPNMDSYFEVSAASAKRQRRDSGWGGSSNRSAESAYPSHMGPPRARDSVEQTAPNYKGALREFNEQIIFRNPQWDRSSRYSNSDKDSPK